MASSGGFANVLVQRRAPASPGTKEGEDMIFPFFLADALRRLKPGE
jgi:hypothetical protein